MVYGQRSESLLLVLLTEYAPGAAIGWHKDRSVFGDAWHFSLVALRLPLAYQNR